MSRRLALGEGPQDREAMGKRLVAGQSEPAAEAAGLLDLRRSRPAMLARPPASWAASLVGSIA